MCSVLEDQLSRTQTVNHLLLIRNYVSLLGVTLWRNGYLIVVLLDVLSKHGDKYQELFLCHYRKKINEALITDKLGQMYMKEKIPDCCRIVPSFIEKLDSFMSHGGHLDFYDMGKEYLERLPIEGWDEAFCKIIISSVGGVTQAMQMADNMAVFEHVCDFFSCHVTQVSGIPSRIAQRGRKHFPLTKACDTSKGVLRGMFKQKVCGNFKSTNSVQDMEVDLYFYCTNLPRMQVPTAKFPFDPGKTIYFRGLMDYAMNCYEKATKGYSTIKLWVHFWAVAISSLLGAAYKNGQSKGVPRLFHKVMNGLDPPMDVDDDGKLMRKDDDGC